MPCSRTRAPDIKQQRVAVDDALHFVHAFLQHLGAGLDLRRGVDPPEHDDRNCSQSQKA